MTRATPLWLLVAAQGIISAASLIVEIVAGRLLVSHICWLCHTGLVWETANSHMPAHRWGARLAEQSDCTYVESHQSEHPV